MAMGLGLGCNWQSIQLWMVQCLHFSRFSLQSPSIRFLEVLVSCKERDNVAYWDDSADALNLASWVTADDV
jgi:hypothetical protein